MSFLTVEMGCQGEDSSCRSSTVDPGTLENKETLARTSALEQASR